MLSILLPALAAMRLPAAPRAPHAVQASFGALTTAFSMAFAADAVELYRDAATAEDLGTRPVIAGVPAGVIYFALALCVQAGIFLQGRQSTMFMKSKEGGLQTVVDGKVVKDAEAFTRSPNEAAKAAAQALRDAVEAGPDDDDSA